MQRTVSATYYRYYLRFCINVIQSKKNFIKKAIQIKKRRFKTKKQFKTKKAIQNKKVIKNKIII